MRNYVLHFSTILKDEVVRERRLRKRVHIYARVKTASKRIIPLLNWEGLQTAFGQLKRTDENACMVLLYTVFHKKQPL